MLKPKLKSSFRSRLLDFDRPDFAHSLWDIIFTQRCFASARSHQFNA